MTHIETKVKRILVVEDDFIIRDSVIEILVEEGYQAIGVENGKKALDYLNNAQFLPCAILLDLMMPIMDGWQFRSIQENDPKFQRIPVIVITADGHAQQKAEKMKANGWVKKPIDIKPLLDTVGRVCA